MSGLSDSLPAFPKRCRKYAADAWDASFEHPFVRALIDGSLAPERFKFYQMQDVRYEYMFWEQAWTQQEWPV